MELTLPWDQFQAIYTPLTAILIARSPSLLIKGYSNNNKVFQLNMHNVMS